MGLDSDTGTERYGPDDEIARFASVASHDLRNSLATLRGFLDLIAEEAQFSELGTHLFGRTFEVTERMSVLIDGIGEHGRARRRPLEPQATDIRDAVTSALQQLPPTLAAVGVTVEVGDIPPVRADPHALVVVLRNVLDNAVRYRAAEDPPRVQVSGRLTDATVVVTIDDDGPGLPEGDEEAVFEPFSKTLNSRGHQTTGLGLATAQVLIERSHGTIRADNLPGTGTRITIELPPA